MSNEMKIYEATENAKDTAFKLVPNAASTGHAKACETLNYICCKTEKEPKFSLKKQQVLKAARLAYMQATV